MSGYRRHRARDEYWLVAEACPPAPVWQAPAAAVLASVGRHWALDAGDDRADRGYAPRHLPADQPADLLVQPPAGRQVAYCPYCGDRVAGLLASCRRPGCVVAEIDEVIAANTYSEAYSDACEVTHG